MGRIDTYPSQTSSAPQSGSTLGYAEVTAVQSGITAETDLTGLSITVTVPAGRRLKLSAGGIILCNTSASVVTGNFKEGATNLGRWSTETMAIGVYTRMDGSVIVSPSAGTHTYKLSLIKESGSGTVDFVAAAAYPAYILAEDITGNQNIAPSLSVPVGLLGQSQAVIFPTTASTTLVDLGVSVNVVVPAGRTLRLSARMGVSGPVGDIVDFYIRQDGVDISTSPSGSTYWQDAGWGTNVPPIDILVSPSAGAHVYTCAFRRATGTGTTTSQGCILYVEDITPTPAPGTGAPGSTLGYAEVTANQTGISTEAALTGLSVTISGPAGRRIRVSSQIQLQSATTSGTSLLRIKEGATTLQVSQSNYNTTAGNGWALRAEAVLSPSVGTHTYNLTVQGTAGTVDMIANPSAPISYILVEDITGAVWPTGSQVTAGLVASEAWTAFSNAPAPTSGAFTTATGTGAYIKLGRTVHYRFSAVITTVGTGTGDVKFTLPVAPESTVRAFGMGREDGVSGNVLVVYSGGGSIGQIRAPAALASGQVYDVAGTYEAAS